MKSPRFLYRGQKVCLFEAVLFFFLSYNNVRNITRPCVKHATALDMQHVGVHATRWRKWIFAGWHPFVIRQLRRMTKRLRGWKRIISSELIARTHSPRDRELPIYLPTYLISFRKLRYLELIVNLWESLLYRCFRRFRATRIDLYCSLRKKIEIRPIKLWWQVHLICTRGRNLK